MRTMSPKMRDALNAQIVNELFSSNAYLSVASYFDSLGLKVLSRLFFKQSDEERGHALRILKYILSVGEPVEVGSIPATQATFQSVEQAVESANTQEHEVTSQIHALMGHAEGEKDYATVSFLKWFVDEQVEELSTVSELLQLVKLAGPGNMLMVEDRLLRLGVGGGAVEVD